MQTVNDINTYFRKEIKRYSELTDYIELIHVMQQFNSYYEQLNDAFKVLNFFRIFPTNRTSLLCEYTIGEYGISLTGYLDSEEKDRILIGTFGVDNIVYVIDVFSKDITSYFIDKDNKPNYTVSFLSDEEIEKIKLIISSNDDNKKIRNYCINNFKK